MPLAVHDCIEASTPNNLRRSRKAPQLPPNKTWNPKNHSFEEDHLPNHHVFRFHAKCSRIKSPGWWYQFGRPWFLVRPTGHKELGVPVAPHLPTKWQSMLPESLFSARQGGKTWHTRPRVGTRPRPGRVMGSLEAEEGYTVDSSEAVDMQESPISAKSFIYLKVAKLEYIKSALVSSWDTDEERITSFRISGVVDVHQPSCIGDLLQSSKFLKVEAFLQGIPLTKTDVFRGSLVTHWWNYPIHPNPILIVGGFILPNSPVFTSPYFLNSTKIRFARIL